MYFSNIQAVTKKYRLGLDVTKDLEELRHSTEWRSQQSWPCLCKSSSEACIVNGEIVFRNQFHIFMPARGTFTNIDLWAACPHQRLTKPRLASTDPGPFAEMLVRRLSHLHNETSCAKCTGLQQRGSCDTEYRLDHKEFMHGTVLVATAWVNLGEGRSLEDPKWIQHLCRFGVGFGPAAQKLKPTERYSGSLGALQEAFDAQCPLSVESSVSPSLHFDR